MRKQAALVGSGYFALYAVLSIYHAFLPLFYRSFLSDLTTIGFLMSSGNLIVVALQPWWGARSDRTRTRLGRRRPYILSGMLLAACFRVAIPLAAQTSLAALLATMILLNLAICVFRAPLFALLGDLFTSTARPTASGIINAIGSSGAALALLGGGWLFRASQSYPFVMVGACLVLAALCIWFGISEPPPPSIASLRATNGRASALAHRRELLAGARRSHVLLLTATFFITIAFAGRSTWFTTYARDTLGLDGGTVATLYGLATPGYILTAVPAGIAAARFGRKHVSLFGILLLILFNIAWYLSVVSCSLAPCRAPSACSGPVGR